MVLDDGLAAVRRAYGPDADLYADVLRVPPAATGAEIREAFFCLRYDLYRRLEDRNGAGGDGFSGGFSGGGAEALTSDERREVEARMDAVAGAFQVLGDPGRRRAYDAARAGTDAAGEPAGNEDGLGSEGDAAASPTLSPRKLSPAQSDTHHAGTPPGQHRSVFHRRLRAHAERRAASASARGINELAPRAVAEPVLGGLNARLGPVLSADQGANSGGSPRAAGEASGPRVVVTPSRRTDESTPASAESPDGSALGTLGEDTVFEGTEADPRVARPPDAAAPEGGAVPPWADFSQVRQTPAAADVAADAPEIPAPPARDDADDAPPAGGRRTSEEPEVPLPSGVDTLNVREQLLYQQMLFSQQQHQHQRQQQQQRLQQQQQQPGQGGPQQQPGQGGPQHRSGLGSRYDARDDRGDAYAVRPARQDRGDPQEDGGEGTDKSLASPKGAEEFDRAVERSWIGRKARGGLSKPRPSPETATTAESSAAEETELPVDPGAEGPDGEGYDCRGEDTRGTEVDEDALTYEDTLATGDDDTRTYDDATMQSYADDTATLEDTLGDQTDGDSTWASEYETDDDATSCATESLNPGYGLHDPREEGGKYSPGHKKGTKPQPILRTGSAASGRKRADGGRGKRVTVHSHRGRGDAEDDDLSQMFDDVLPTCSTLLSLAAIREELAGTYKDFTSALHQVGNAFVIGPDDIDRVADVVRDAKVDLGENCHQQLQGGSLPGNEKPPRNTKIGSGSKQTKTS